MLLPLECAVDVPPWWRSPAEYAIGELLRELGLVPRLVAPEDLSAGGLYYGSRPEAAPEGVVAIGCHASTLEFFGGRAAYDPRRAFETEAVRRRVPVLFPASAEGGADLVASAFFWLSGHQEVVTRERDQHGRFPYRASLQAALGCVQVPVVDHYRRLLGERLRGSGVRVTYAGWAGKPWAVLPTHDVDHAGKRRLGTLMRLPGRACGRRAAILQALAAPNPRLRSIDLLARLEGRYRARATYFFKPASRSRYDVSYDPASGALRRRLARLQAAGHQIGLHPGYFSADHPGRLAAERDRLAAILGQRPTAVRQHYLRFDPLLTPSLLAAAGFALDSSLGFSEHEGFRRGTAFPFRLWDHQRGAALPLWEVPLAVMDTTLFAHRGLGPDAAEAAAWQVLQAAREVGGCAVLLWHNTAFDEVDFAGQGDVFARLLHRADEAGAALLSLEQALGARRDAPRTGPDQAPR